MYNEESILSLLTVVLTI